MLKLTRKKTSVPFFTGWVLSTTSVKLVTRWRFPLSLPHSRHSHARDYRNGDSPCSSCHERKSSHATTPAFLFSISFRFFILFHTKTKQNKTKSWSMHACPTFFFAFNTRKGFCEKRKSSCSMNWIVFHCPSDRAPRACRIISFYLLTDFFVSIFF